MVDLLRAWEDFAGELPEKLKAELDPQVASRYYPYGNGPTDEVLRQWRTENVERTGVADILHSRMLDPRQFIAVDDEHNSPASAKDDHGSKRDTIQYARL